MSLRRFLVSKTFFKHLGIAIAITVVIVLAVFKFLNIYTLHGDSMTLPDFSGLTKQELNKYDLTDKFEFVVIDSVYDADKRKGSIISQDPLANSRVKPGRKIYLTVVARMPEQVTMPDLVDLTLRQAVSQLETYGLKVGKMEYVADIARNAVLQQTYQGEVIKPGTKIEKGSKINLVIGKGMRDTDVSLPFLVGQKPEKAIKHIYKSSLNVGTQIYENVQDTSFARVYRTRPGWSEGKEVEMGTYVDIWYRSGLLIDFDSLINTMRADTLQKDSFVQDSIPADTLKESETEEPIF
ncbi:MAG: PASTA domain-containing protein [Bacteroidales bacterium]|nr:PASTA domain-containing protein [Bacteroidales bacterium]